MPMPYRYTEILEWVLAYWYRNDSQPPKSEEGEPS